MLCPIMMEGYMLLKSRTAIHGCRPASTSWTYPPVIWPSFASAEPVNGTAMFFLSARRITKESMSWLVLPFAAVSNGTMATAATASFRRTA